MGIGGDGHRVAFVPLLLPHADLLPAFALFGVTLGVPVIVAAWTVGSLVRRGWPVWLVYMCAVGAGIVGWFAALLAVIGVFHPVGGIA